MKKYSRFEYNYNQNSGLNQQYPEKVYISDTIKEKRISLMLLRIQNMNQ